MRHDEYGQTPSTGLRHPSLEEGAGKRCSECGVPADCRVRTVRIFLLLQFTVVIRLFSNFD